MLAQIVAQDGPEEVPPGLEESKMIALVAYLQRLGTDISKTEAEPETVASNATEREEATP